MTALGDDRSERLARDRVQRAWLAVHSPLRHVDVGLVLVPLALSALGLVMIYSATAARLQAQGLDPSLFVNRQLISFAVGIAVMVAVMSFDYRQLRAWGPLLYVGAIALLVWVLFDGTIINASRSWIVIGGFQFQPSELAKPALIITLAALFHERREEALGLRALVEALVLAGVPMLLILRQPDFGTFTVFAALTFGVLLMAGVRVRYLALLAGLAIAAVLGALQLDVMQEYQEDRLATFIDPTADPGGAGFNVHQAMIAIGGGGFAGHGLMQGPQTSSAFVPENHTDFIFTVIGEELGFLGAAAVLLLFGVLLWRVLRVVALSRDTFGSLLAAGVAAVIAFHFFINVGMSVGLMPVTGLPLPFVSYGGTSIIASFFMIGLVQSVHMRRHA